MKLEIIISMKKQDYFSFRILKQVDVLIGYDRDPGAVQILDLPDVQKNKK